MENNTTKRPHRGEFSGQVKAHWDFGSNSKGLSLVLTDGAVDIFAGAKPGQFVQLACRDLTDTRRPSPLVRRPFSIAGLLYEKENATGQLSFTIIYRIWGPGTQWLQGLQIGDSINFLGPLGNSFTLPKEPQTPVILLGGGVGLPPMFFLADQLTQMGFREKIALAGIRSQSDFLPDLIQQRFDHSHCPCEIATDDGSYGFKGNIIEALEDLFERQPEWKKARLYACGPSVMLKAVAGVAERDQMNCQVCMEAYMSCGIGICQSCAVPVRPLRSGDANQPPEKRYKLVCTNGPVFNSTMIQWDQLNT